LADRRLFRSRDLDEARAIVAGKFCDHRLDRASRLDLFDACHNRAEGHAASLNFLRYGADVIIEPGELGSFYLVQIPLSGTACIASGAEEVGTGLGCGSVLNPHRHTRMRWREGCAQLLLQIDAAHLTSVAERMLGRSLRAPVTFSTAVDQGNAGIAQWIGKLRTCFALAEKRAVFSAGNPHTQVLVEEQLIAGFLQAQPSDIRDQLDADPARISNMNVRRAVQFIRDRLADPITIADVAQGVGLTPRSLQLGFKSELGRTPLQVLREERLLAARRLLVEAGPADRVGDICDRVGFSHFGRFSSQYRERFGELPTMTKGQLARGGGSDQPGQAGAAPGKIEDVGVTVICGAMRRKTHPRTARSDAAGGAETLCRHGRSAGGW